MVKSTFSKMTELIACLSTGKGSWREVSALIREGKYDKIYLITNDFGKQNYTKDDKTELIAVIKDRRDQTLTQLRDEIHDALKDKVKDIEVAINFVSGSGDEHMALMSALMKLGIGFRIVLLTENGVIEL